MAVLRIRLLSVRIAVALAAAILTWPLSIACGSGGNTTQSTSVHAPSSANRDRLLSGAYDIGKARTSAIRSSEETSAPVKTILQDGKLEFAEYESAVLAMLSCVKSTGASIRDRDPALSSRGLYTWLISSSTEKGDLGKQIDFCFERELGIIDLLWKEHLAPSETDVQNAMQELSACLKQAGLGDRIPESRLPRDFQTIPRSLALAGDDSAIPVYVACARAAQDQFGLIGFVGESPE